MKGTYISFKTNTKAIDKRFYKVLHKKRKKTFRKNCYAPKQKFNELKKQNKFNANNFYL